MRNERMPLPAIPVARACRPDLRGPTGPFSLKTLHRRVFQALEPLETVHRTVSRALGPPKGRGKRSAERDVLCCLASNRAICFAE